jgi:hypothetical protein
MRRTLLLTVVALMSAGATWADLMSLVTTRTGSDTANWSQLGPDNTPINNPFSAHTTGGIGINGSFAGVGPGSTAVEDPISGSWVGNFTIGDELIYNNALGALSLLLNTGVPQVGAQIQATFYGLFTAKIDAYNGATLLGSFLENGDSTSLENGSAIYLGVQDSTSANITKVVFSLTSAASSPSDFAINRLSVTAPVPEPASWVLLCSVLAVVGVARRRVLAR